MDDREKENHDRDVIIAENEATREMFSKIRVSSWAIALAVVLGLMLLLYVVSK